MSDAPRRSGHEGSALQASYTPQQAPEHASPGHQDEATPQDSQEDGVSDRGPHDRRQPNCPHCGNSLQGEPIPEEFRQKGHSGPPEKAPTHVDRTIGVVIRGVYDGVLFWQCPDCGGRWYRFPLTDRLTKVAYPYVEEGKAVG